MKKEVSELTRNDLPLFHRPMSLLYILFSMLGTILLHWYMRRDDILYTLLLTGLGITTTMWFAGKWELQAIKICLVEGKSLNPKNISATMPGKKARLYKLGGFILFLVIFIIALRLPEKFSSQLTELTELLPEPGRFLKYADILLGVMYYLFGGIIGLFIPIYLRVRKLPK